MTTLFDRARQGDAAAETEIHDLVQTFARQICRGGGPAWAGGVDWEDVAQDAGIRILTVGLRQFTGYGSERSYIYSVVRSTVIQLARAAGRQRRREEAYSGRLVEHPSAGRGLDVARILSGLSPDCRALLERVFLEGASYRDLARELGIAESSVRSRLSRCVQAARRIADGWPAP